MVLVETIRRLVDCLGNSRNRENGTHSAGVTNIATIALNFTLWLCFTFYVTSNYENKGLFAIIGGGADGVSALPACDSMMAQAAIDNEELSADFADRYRACMIPDLSIPVLDATISYDRALHVVCVAAVVDFILLVMYAVANQTKKDFTPYSFYEDTTGYMSRYIAAGIRAVYSGSFLLVLTLLSLITIKSWQMPMSAAATTLVGVTKATRYDWGLCILSTLLCLVYASYASVSRQLLYVPGNVELAGKEAPEPKQHSNGDNGDSVINRAGGDEEVRGDFKSVEIIADERTEMSFFIRQCLMPFVAIFLLECGGSVFETPVGDVSLATAGKLFELVLVRLGATAILLNTSCGDLTIVYRFSGDLVLGAINLMSPSSSGKFKGKLKFTPSATPSASRITQALEKADLSGIFGTNSEHEGSQLIRRKVGLGRAASSAQVSSFVL